MDEQALNRIIRFLMVVDRCNHAIYVGEEKGSDNVEYISGTDLSISKKRHNSKLALDALLRALASETLSKMAKEEAVNPINKETRVPIEPLEYSESGFGYLKNGIGQVARPEVVELFLELDGFRKRRGVVTKIRGRKNAEYLMGLLQEIPQPERILALLSKVPDEYIDLVKNVGFGTSSGKMEMDGVENKQYEPKLSVIGLEQCNRACGHCGTLATPRRDRLISDTLEVAMEKMGFAAKVTFSYGEPFLWKEVQEDRILNVANLIEMADKFGAKLFQIVSSGINFQSADEASAARSILELPGELIRNIILSLTVSDFPHFTEGIVPREVQKDTFKFACDAGIALDLLSFIPFQRAFREVTLACAMERFPDIPESVMIQTSGKVIKLRTVGGIGRAAPKMVPSQDFFYYLRAARWECLSFKGLQYSGMDESLPRAKKIEDMLRNDDGSFNQEGILAMMANGDLVPGCCQFIATYAKIASVSEDSKEIRRKTNEFFRRLDKLRMAGELDCTSCVASTQEIRNPRLLKRGHGEKIFSKVMKKRKEFAGF